MENSIQSDRSVYYALIAHALQKYDVFLYGFFIPIMAPIFFPVEKDVAVLAAFGTFAAGYFARPLGSIFFGHIGDKYGRKSAFMLSVLLVIIPTLIIALLPGFNKIGIWAPISLIICRLMQGFAAGGEFSGAVIYVSEHFTDQRQGFAGSIVRSVGFLGVSLGTGIGYLMLHPSMPEYAWRFPFILGAIISVLSYLLRRKMTESPEFICKPNDSKVSIPLIRVFRERKLNMLCNLGISGCAYVFLYFTTIYMGSVYKHEELLSSSEGMLVSAFILLLWGILTPMAGIIADYIGLKKFLNYILAITFLMLLPAFKIFYTELTFTNVFTLQLILTFFGAAYFGPAPGLFKSLFPANSRFSGVSLSNNFAQATIGSTTPAIVAAAITMTGSNLAPAYWLTFACLIAWLGIYLMNINKTTT